MNRPKALGLALLAIFAISALSAAVARAVPEFHSEIEKPFVYGEQEGENIFTTSAGKWKCKQVIFDSLFAQLAERPAPPDFGSKMWAVRPLWATCSAFGQVAVVDNPPPQTGSACDFYLFADTSTMTITGTPLPLTFFPHTACEIKVTVPSGNCNIVINQQAPGKPKVEYAVVLFGGVKAIKVTWGLEEISYTVEGAKGTICGEPGVHNDGKYQGNAVLRGYEEEPFVAVNQVPIWWP
jgi:hypothetical protein